MISQICQYKYDPKKDFGEWVGRRKPGLAITASSFQTEIGNDRDQIQESQLMTAVFAMTSGGNEILMIRDPHCHAVQKTAKDASTDKKEEDKEKPFIYV